MGVSGKPRLSGIQKQVLALYRGFLRAARTKSPEERAKIESIVSAEFRHNSTQIDRKNFLYIEYLIRRGKKQLDQLKSPDTIVSRLEKNKNLRKSIRKGAWRKTGPWMRKDHYIYSSM